jgi:hypothetical protein
METLFPNQEWHHVFLEICTRAMRHGITDEADVEAFFNYVFAFGRDFGESAATAWAKGPLRNSHLTGHEKMLAIQTEYLKLSSHVGS